MCKISVVMGVYNIGKLKIFGRAMDSVLKQTVRDFEFIICDDGSTDHTYSILLKYAKQDGRIRILHNQAQCGLAAALNKCISISAGAYIARQDADDISLPDRFHAQAEFLERYPKISFVGSNVVLYDPVRGDYGERILPEYPKKEDFLFTNPYVHGSLMFQRAAFEKAGRYRIAKETRRAEDYDLLMHMYALGLRGANIQKPLYKYLEDTDALRRRKYIYRIDEAKVRLRGFGELGLLPHALPYVVKPLIVGLLPYRMLVRLKNGHTMQIKGPA